LKNNYRTEIDYLPINKWPESERPREKLIKKGPEFLSDCELLAIILRTGMGSSKKRFSALDLAKKILTEYSSLKNLLDLSLSEFLRINGIGEAKAAQIIAALELGRRAVSEKNGNNISFRCSEEVANYYIPLLKDLKKEQFRVLLLDIKNKVIKEVLISMGSLTSSIVHPREVIKPVIKESAASVIFIHNHPSGDPEPSSDDIEVTDRLCKSCGILGIDVLDHIIIAEGGYFSFKQKHLI
jgi:DNA repair protein RadC